MSLAVLRSLVRDPHLRRLAGPGSLAFAIKIASAGLSYAMFVVLARAMSLADYGLFGFGFSWAILLSHVASSGQPTLAMRLLPAFNGVDDPRRVGALRFAHGVLLAATALVVAAWISAGALLGGLDGLYLVAVGAVIGTTALSDLETGVLRAEGGVGLALIPREILWRILTILVCLPVLFGWTGALDATSSLLGMAGLLMLCVIPQVAARPATRSWLRPSAPSRMEAAPWARMSAWFALSAVITAAAPALAVIALGLIATPEETGPFFAAVKTSQMLMLILVAGNIVAGPLFVRHLAKGEIGSAQRIAAAIALVSTLFSLAGALALVPAGDLVLRLFGDGFESALASLLILAFGMALRAIFGPAGQLLQMGGEERVGTRIALISNLAGIAAMAPLAMAFGPAGAAAALSAGQIAGAFWSHAACRARLGVDASPLGLLDRRAGGGAT